jgi:3'(2'), 5'-bisphosphate nucleotidase
MRVSCDDGFDRELAPFAARLDDLTTMVGRAAAVILDTDPARVPRRRKADHSFVTAADEAAQAVLLEGLSQAFPELPAISEEISPHPATIAPCFALIDPLDGTREFLEGRDEFTVNLAIVIGGVPAIGIIAAPALGLMWRGVRGRGAVRLQFDAGRPWVHDGIHSIHTRASPPDGMRALVSRSHLDAATAGLLSRLTIFETIACGSSMKFCRIAEGSADIYPRLAPMFEWDMAAGDAVLAAAGGAVIRPDGRALLYGEMPDQFRVGAFLAFGCPTARESLLEAAREALEVRPDGLQSEPEASP